MTSRWIPRITFPGGGGGGPPPQIEDHFAPKYIVGNVPAGDPAVAQGAPFFYVPDPGDGSGIALALTQFGGPGDVWIRPGTYDLGSGATPSPLVIPPGVRVQGAGAPTIIVGRSTADQGIFTMDAGSSLLDMTLVVNASDAGGMGSVAVVDVLSTSAVAIVRVSITFATDPAGALRYGIQFAGGGPFLAAGADLNDVYVTATTTTGIGDPTACYAWAPSGGFVTGISVWGTGGDIGMYSPSAQGIVVVTTLILRNWTERGVWWSGTSGGAVRIDQSAIIASGAATSPTAILLEASGGHVLRSISIQGNNTLGSRGIVMDSLAGTSFNSVEVQDCEISGFMEGMIFGGVLTTVDDLTVSDCTMFVGTGILATHRGIAILNTSSRRCHIRGSTIQVVSPLGASAEAVVVEGERHEVSGNFIEQNAFGTGIAVDLRCSRSIFDGNTVFSQDQFGVRLAAGTIRNVIGDNEIEVDSSIAGSACVSIPATSQRHTVGDNVLTQTNITVPQTAVRCDGSLCTIGDNSIEISVSIPTSPAIAFGGTSANNACVGNICSGSPSGPSTPVTDLGAGNEIAHNVGV